MTAPIVRWYVHRWGGAPSRREFVRETDKFLVSSRNGRETREAKNSTYYSFYATEEAALAAVAARQAAKDEERRIARIRAAAPDLLDALCRVRDVETLKRENNEPGLSDELLTAIDSAIAKATGEGA